MTGHLSRITDESGTTNYSFDSLGRMISKTTVIIGKTFTLSYSWGDTGSAIDKLTAITYPSGSRVNYSYDAQGYVSGISLTPINASGNGLSATSTPLLSAISYNADNNITGWLWADGKARSISYDSFGQVSGYSLGEPTGTGMAAGVMRTLTRDAAARIAGYSHSNNAVSVPGLNQSFGYDNLNRLLGASLGAGTASASTSQYSYDANGNRTSKVIGATSYNNTVDASSNKLLQTQDTTGTASYSHDAAGNVTGDGINTFSYSDRGRMSSASNTQGTTSYLYNGLSQRVSKAGPTGMVPTGAAYFVYDEQGQLLGEYDANQNPIYETLYLGATPVGVIKQTGSAGSNNIAVSLYNVHADHLNTPRMITRQSDNAMVWRWDAAEAFGNSPANQNPNALGAFTFNQRFPGQVWDAETGLNQNWHRDYDARQGRYRQSDPIGLRGGVNTYGYVEGNPVSMTDPIGLMGGNGAVDRGKPSVAVFGCLGVVCASFGTADATTQWSAELTLGGGIEICDPPPPMQPDQQMCSKTDGQAQPQPPGIPLPKKIGGAFIGPSIKSDGRLCMKVGPHVSIPFTPSFEGAARSRWSP